MPYMLAQCASNAHNALVLRHLSRAPNCTQVKLINPFLGPLKHKMKHYYLEALPVKYEGWRVGKPLQKLQRIDKSFALDSLKLGVTNAFVKAEVSCSMPKKARLIQGNRNEYTAYHNADEYAALNEALKRIGTETFKHPTGCECQFVYAGGLNHDELSDIVSGWWATKQQHYWFDERDGKNWDATMNRELLLAEAQVYEMLKMRSTKEFIRRSSKCVGNIHIRDKHRSFVLRYLTAWKRLSGDWNTSAGNSIVSMIIVYTVLTLLPTALRPTRIRALFMGDDYLAMLEFNAPIGKQTLMTALNQAEAQCGITPERGMTQDPLLVSFISLGIWPTKDGNLAFIPHPGKQLGKLFVAVKKVPQELMLHYRSEVARSFLKTYTGFEFMMHFLKYHIRPDLLNDERVFAYLQCDHLYKIKSLGTKKIDWAWGFFVKYGMPITSLVWDQPKTMGLLRHPVVDHMIEWEGSDPITRM